jgi:cytochrome c
VGSEFIAGALTLAAAAYVATGTAAALDLDAAQQQFLKSCGTCHTLGAGEVHRQGPNLHGVYGREAGSLADFKYSEALATGGWTWTERTLDPWLENAQAAHPGTIMNYRQRDPAKRALIIELFKSLAGEG